MTVIRTLPLQLDPIPGEALDSWLAALAHRSHTAWADMLTAAGLGTPSCHLRRQFCFPPITASWQPSAPSMPYLNRALLEGFQSPSRDGPRHPVSHTVGPARLAQRHTVAAGQVRHGVAGDAVDLADALQPQLLPLVQLDQLSARDSGYPRGAHVGIEC